MNWEYLVETYYKIPDKLDLNTYGLLGWELCSVIYEPGPSRTTVFLKRKLPEKKEKK